MDMDTNALPNSTAPTKYGLLPTIVLGFTYTFVLAKVVSSYKALMMHAPCYYGGFTFTINDHTHEGECTSKQQPFLCGRER